MPATSIPAPDWRKDPAVLQALEGVSPAQIAFDLRLHPSTVYTRLARARRNGAPIPTQPAGRRSAPHPHGAQIIAMIRDGVPRAQIARTLGIGQNTVYRLVAQARMLGIDLPGGGDVHLAIARQTLRALSPAATARGITPAELAAQLLRLLADDPGLLAAVIDDGVAPCAS